MKACICRKIRVRESKLAAIPARFRVPETYRPETESQVEAWEQVSSNIDGSYFLMGVYGAGKTHLMAAQYRALVMKDIPALWTSMAELLLELRKAELDSDYVCAARERVYTAERFHLFVDDVDKFKVTDFKFEVLFGLLNTLYERKLNLTMTSNCTLSELIRLERLHPSVVRRIDETCKVIHV